MILENLKRLNSKFKGDIWIRIPVIPGVNDFFFFFRQIGSLIKGLKNIKRIDLLPFHKLGEGKYTSLDRTPHLQDLEAPGTETMEKFQKVLQEMGFQVKLN